MPTRLALVKMISEIVRISRTLEPEHAALPLSDERLAALACAEARRLLEKGDHYWEDFLSILSRKIKNAQNVRQNPTGNRPPGAHAPAKGGTVVPTFRMRRGCADPPRPGEPSAETHERTRARAPPARRARSLAHSFLPHWRCSGKPTLHACRPLVARGAFSAVPADPTITQPACFQLVLRRFKQQRQPTHGPNPLHRWNRPV